MRTFVPTDGAGHGGSLSKTSKINPSYAVLALDGDGDVIDGVDGTLNITTNRAVRGEMDLFLSVWGGEANVEQIRRTRDCLNGGVVLMDEEV